jgi:hypothetical protein
MCWFCGEPIKDETIGRSLRCEVCGKDLRSCRHCRSYLPGSRADCGEAKAEQVADKERANFCDWFSLDKRFRVSSAGEKKALDAAGKARDEFWKLFGD